jgi:hypothetical protein
MGPPFRFHPDPPAAGRQVERGDVCAPKTTSDDDGESTSASSAAHTAGFKQGAPMSPIHPYANASPWPKNTREEREGRLANSSRKKLPTVGNGIGPIGPIGFDAVGDDDDGGSSSRIRDDANTPSPDWFQRHRRLGAALQSGLAGKRLPTLKRKPKVREFAFWVAEPGPPRLVRALSGDKVT